MMAGQGVIGYGLGPMIVGVDRHEPDPWGGRVDGWRGPLGELPGAPEAGGWAITLSPRRDLILAVVGWPGPSLKSVVWLQRPWAMLRHTVLAHLARRPLRVGQVFAGPHDGEAVWVGPGSRGMR